MFTAYLVLLFLYCITSIRCNCKVSVKDDVHVLMLKNNVETDAVKAFYYPIGNDLTIPSNGAVLFGCPGGHVKGFGTVDVIGTCDGGKVFTISGKKYNIKSITCTSRIEITTKRNGICDSQPHLFNIEVGFQLSARFIKNYQVCFDDHLKSPFYSLAHMTQNIYPLVCSRPGKFDEFGYYGLTPKLDAVYTKVYEQEIINSQLGLSKTDPTYVVPTTTGQKYLAKGHLISKTDFVYSPEQDCTFAYVNTGPQWQELNNGNWKSLEKSVRQYAKDNSKDLTVLTGTMDVLELPHSVNHAMTKIYLYPSNDKVPIPKYFWKFVYDQPNQAGIVFVATNNMNTPAKLCPRDCAHVASIPIRNNKYVTCCTYSEFRRMVPHLPDYIVTKIIV